MTTTFNVPTRSEVSPANQAIFDNLQKMLGFVPNLYAGFAHSEHALGNYLALQSGKSSLSGKEREVINLVVSQYNNCLYCLSAHTVVGKMQGFTDEQIIAIRKGDAAFDAKLNALTKLTLSIAANKGHADAALLDAFYAAGYNKGSLVDVLMVIGDKTISNYLHAATDIPVDFPIAPVLSA
ncbi:alkylhydroperoxidase [Herbaspirillum sp. meg3]|jgi:uncharacterized peroxidase-related enzyme|uniref:carboxymuconolactone decarboxylase family protein n=1 Tax=Herbaspirillum sp. meg3 TaxID=2025949 RepID=UPI000B98AA19|nr:carboxymuconolactone decarboxylase family protein [Herbaspirillum sp. meg3]ASU41066.1 alkylhydroperoxidase [Herbaspirillum sp. meg3]